MNNDNTGKHSQKEIIYDYSRPTKNAYDRLLYYVVLWYC